MLRQPDDGAGIQVRTADCAVGPDATIHIKALRGPCRSARQAIFIHGGGMGGNHTLVERPSRLLIEEGYFDEMILPDRRGEGASSALTRPVTITDHATDMKRVLDWFAVDGPVTAMGISYGGPIALALASLDPRVERVVLVASGPSLRPQRAIMRILVRSSVYERLGRVALRRLVGTLPPQSGNFDSVYDASSARQVGALFQDALRRTPRERLESLVANLRATLDAETAGLAEDITLRVPVLRIIGERDEIWGTRLSAQEAERLPQLSQHIVPGARRHKDVFFLAQSFYNVLTHALEAAGVTPAPTAD